MSNSFNIDVKPEIAAVAADIAANLVQILSNASALATIQTTTLPNIATQNTNIQSAIDAIADPQLPDILTAIGDNLTAIGVIDGIVDAIKLKTDLIPTSKSEYKSLYGSAILSTSWETILEVTAEGRLYNAWFYDNDDTFNIRITIDTNSMTLNGLLATTAYDTIRNTAYNSGHLINVVTPIKESDEILNIEFKNLLKVEIQRTSTSGYFFYKVIYGEI